MAIAVAHHRGGRIAEAIRLYREALASAPGNFDVLYLLGVATAQSGDVAGASALLAQATAIKPRHADAQFQFGNTLMDLGRPAEAVGAYERAVAAEPRLAPAHHALGLALAALDRVDEAIAAFRRALSAAPNAAPTLFNLGNALMRRGKANEAIDAYRRAIAAKPDHARAHANLAAALEMIGRPDEAVWHWRDAARLDPARESNWMGFARGLEGVRFTSADPALAPDLLRCLTHPAVDPQLVAAAVVTYLSASPASTALLKAVETGADAAIERAGDAFAREPLALALLENALIADPGWERALTALRYVLLRASDNESRLPLLCALAHQGFATEYVYARTADEATRAAALQQEIDDKLGSDADIAAATIAMLAMYVPLHRLKNVDRLAARAWPAALEAVIRRQAIEPAEERRLAADIRALTPIDDVVSRAVQAQYEENPYPRWHRVSSPGPARPLDDIVRELFPAVTIDAPPRGRPVEMLIAGCGTGRQALGSARRFADMRVLAVDLSRASLASALRKTREAGIGSIEYGQADILALGALDRRFDLIECGGVLHHMADPLTGWRVLNGLLTPGGYMQIGLYSERARRSIVEARAFIAAQGYGSTADDIRRCRQDIQRNDQGFARRLLHNPEFYAVSACRDLLFHVQEHRFTLPQIAAMLAELDLEFLGFEPLSAATASAYRARFPEDRAMTALENWERFEAEHPDSFAGMYQFWVRKPLHPVNERGTP